MHINLKSKQQRRFHHGQSLVEMALMVPILLVLVIGAIEFGRLFFTKIVITNAAREGAYYLSTHPSDYANTVSAAENEAANSGIPEITVAIAQKNCCTRGVYSIDITVETKVRDILILSFLGNTLSMTKTTHNEFPLSSSVEMMVQ